MAFYRANDLVIACVRAGQLYSFDYVTKLRNMVGRHMTRPYELVCLTDQPDRASGVTFIDTSEIGLDGWWQKMILFEPQWRGRSKIVYLDLDTVIIGDLAPLADVPGEFAILESPVRRLMKIESYPCAYNSSVMVIGGGQCGFVWTAFDRDSNRFTRVHARYGDQKAIEELYPSAPFLQDMLPDFFCNYRHITNRPPRAAVVNFGGSNKPHNCDIDWVVRQWA